VPTCPTTGPVRGRPCPPVLPSPAASTAIPSAYRLQFKTWGTVRRARLAEESGGVGVTGDA
jgi:hypothetical protein